MEECQKDIKIYVTPKNEFYLQKGDIILEYTQNNFGAKKVNQIAFSTGIKTYETSIIIGKIDTNKNSYLITSKKTKFICEFLKAKIYKIEQFDYILITNNESIKEEEDNYLKMLDDFLSRNALYFSDKLDLTVSFKNYNLQQTYPSRCNTDSYVFPYTQKNFCWNYNIIKFYDEKLMKDFIYPVINGYIGISELEGYSIENAKYIIISRKEHLRSGMRFLCRGGDSEGNCANFAEIEEFLYIEDNKTNTAKIYSFSQVRGSIPLIWEQKPNFQLNPPINIKMNSMNLYDCLKAHLDKLVNNYGKIYLVNLIDQKGDQKRIGEQYNKNVEEYIKNTTDAKNNVQFTWFDFHHECKKMKYENISHLTKKQSVKEFLKNMINTEIEITGLDTINNYENITEFMHKKEKVNFIKVQKSTFRTNCIDSLDRTNVIQTAFARIMLQQILYNMKLITTFNQDEPFAVFSTKFEKSFKLMWADNGDYLSKAYSGTGAMKSDFVRTGKRTLKGNIDDGILSLTRLYINNFCDGYNQDCHGIFLFIF